MYLCVIAYTLCFSSHIMSLNMCPHFLDHISIAWPFFTTPSAYMIPVVALKKLLKLQKQSKWLILMWTTIICVISNIMILAAIRETVISILWKMWLDLYKTINTKSLYLISSALKNYNNWPSHYLIKQSQVI